MLDVGSLAAWLESPVMVVVPGPTSICCIFTSRTAFLCFEDNISRANETMYTDAGMVLCFHPRNKPFWIYRGSDTIVTTSRNRSNQVRHTFKGYLCTLTFAMGRLLSH